MNSESLLSVITNACRQLSMAETTFGRLAVNDGKLVARIRQGGRITVETVEKIGAFIEQNGLSMLPSATTVALLDQPNITPLQNFRFFDNRQKYLLFVNTCSEKRVISERVAMELKNIHPRPPAVRLFDAGVGDGTVLASVLRAMHARFPQMPFYVVGKEISREDIRLALEKLADRFCEHPAMVTIMTNMKYTEAPWLTPQSVVSATGLVWHELVLQGTNAAEFDAQILDLNELLNTNWGARVSANSGNPVYEKPVVLVIYREDCRFLMDPIIPRRGQVKADYDIVMASQPYRARAPIEFKVQRVLAPLAQSIGPGGRLIAIHSHGDDPGMEIVREIWPSEDPFRVNRHDLLRATKVELGSKGRHLSFNAYADARSLFRYDMHTLPHEIDSAASIGTSTLLAAWNAATYVAQIEDERLTSAIESRSYIEATRRILAKHQGLWFTDESFIISRRRE